MWSRCALCVACLRLRGGGSGQASGPLSRAVVQPVSDEAIFEHYERGLVVKLGPCNGHGVCDSKVFYCRCHPQWWGANCTKRMLCAPLRCV